ncbi:WD repeat-containing protein 7 [Linnemannia hyalina]|uniref:WD repeat-containing protein 7 n=1 Tax=Linnemannia hyalina TaxID=64524 RepID=A0A9P8BMJ9_9FUNG|nr:WD repeat-containing protein 7 [Linnemannia hyalina]
MASASLSIPIAFWSQSTPTATISTTFACEGYVVAGLEEGLIWVFKATCGPTDAGPPEDIVSLDVEGAKGLMELANLTSPFWIGFARRETVSGPKFILCAGLSNEACILDSTSLEVVRVWGGHQDWVYCTALPGDGIVHSSLAHTNIKAEFSRCQRIASCRYGSLTPPVSRHSKVDVLEHSAMEPRYEIPSGESSVGATATVSDWRPPSDYPPSVMGFIAPVPICLDTTLINPKAKSLTSPSVTFSTMLNDTLVALGHDSGDIRVCPVDEALLDLASGFVNEHAKETTVLKGHIGPISSIFTTDDLMGRSFILSGGKDCSARIWNIDIYLFGGYEHALVSIQWRPPEDYIVLWHADETAFVWQMQTGHLDRIVKGETARAIMADSRWKVCEISPRRPTSSKRAFDCMTVPLGVPGSKATVPVVVMNLKYVLGILSPTRNTDQQSDQPGSKSSAVSPPEPQTSARHRRIFSGQSRASAKAKPGAVEEPVVLSEMAQQCLRAAKVVLGLLITEDDAYAVSIRNLLNIPPPTKTIALGLRG